MVTNPGYRTELAHGRTRPSEPSRGVAIAVEEGPDPGRRVQIEKRRVAIGSHPTNDFVVADSTVSRFHCVLEHRESGILLRDLDSRNGTLLGNLRIFEALLPERAEVTLGRCRLLIEPLGMGLAESTSAFGQLLGTSAAMQRVVQILGHVAPTRATVLLQGETGTGKSLIARVVHEASPRRGHPFTVVDCASLPPTLIESELFGHEKGAFTGATSARPGAFEAAESGTLFLDEIGEIPLELQPKFLRALEDREVRRVGAVQARPIDVRLIAATNRDLALEVKAGRFRSDLYYRLDVVRVRIPSLRERREDIRTLARAFISLTSGGSLPFEIREEDWVAMEAAAWPGNVRELRAAIERSIVLGERSLLWGERTVELPQVDWSLPFREAKRRVVEAFERQFIRRLLAKSKGNLSEAARLGEMDRNYLKLLVNRHTDKGV